MQIRATVMVVASVVVGALVGVGILAAASTQSAVSPTEFSASGATCGTYGPPDRGILTTVPMINRTDKPLVVTGVSVRQLTDARLLPSSLVSDRYQVGAASYPVTFLAGHDRVHVLGSAGAVIPNGQSRRLVVAISATNAVSAGRLNGLYLTYTIGGRHFTSSQPDFELIARRSIHVPCGF